MSNDYDVSSASSIPLENEAKASSNVKSHIITTESFGVSSTSNISRYIIIRGTSTESVTVPLNLKKEKIREQNLLFNRGVVQNKSTTGNTQ